MPKPPDGNEPRDMRGQREVRNAQAADGVASTTDSDQIAGGARGVARDSRRQATRGNDAQQHWED